MQSQFDRRVSKGSLRSALSCLALAGLAAWWAPGVMNAQESAATPETQAAELSPEDVAEMLTRWQEIQLLIGEERRNRKLGLELLNSEVEMLSDEIASLTERLEADQSSIAEADTQREELLAQNEELKSVAGEFEESIRVYEARLKALLPGLPAPLSARIEPVAKNLPEDPENTEQSLAARFVTILGILNEVDKFNQEIHVEVELRDLGNGASAEVTVLYLGISRAYYVTNDGLNAGVGVPSPEGWTWTPDSSIAPQVALAIAIQRNEKPAAYVQLPLSIQ
jgi:hypothetical protein